MNIMRLFAIQISMKHHLVTSTQVGRILHSARKTSGLTQTDLASRVGISQPRLSSLENNAGGMTVDQLLAFCSILGLDLSMEKRSESGTQLPSKQANTPPAEW